MSLGIDKCMVGSNLFFCRLYIMIMYSNLGINHTGGTTTKERQESIMMDNNNLLVDALSPEHIQALLAALSGKPNTGLHRIYLGKDLPEVFVSRTGNLAMT